MKRLIPIVLAAALAAAACGESSGSGTPTTNPPSTTSPTTTAVPPTTTLPPVPVDPDQRVLTVRREGGLMPPEALFSRLPLYTLYADGTLAYEGAVPAIYPGPMLPGVVLADIGADGMARVLTAVVAAGLPEITELYNTDAADQVADGPNTEVTYFDDDGEHFFSVYALEIAAPKDPQAKKLGELVDLLDRLTATSPSAGPFTIERLQVIATTMTADPDNPDAVVESWPMLRSPDEMQDSTFGLLCTVFDVSEDPGALAAFQAGHQLTFFDYEGTVYRLTVRPLLTGEPGCEARR